MHPHDNTSHDVPLKRCSQCGEMKPAAPEYFVRDKSKASGFIPRCKTCKNKPPILDVPLPDGQKVCAKCGEVKPETTEYFPLDKTGRNGFSYRCKACVRQYEAQNSNYFTEYRRAYRQKNRDKLIEAQRAYHAEERNKQRRIERDRLNREKTRDQRREAARRWRENNREAWRALKRADTHRRKTLKSKARGTHTPDDIERQYKAQKGRCYYCRVKVGNIYHVDHVIPLARGGSNGPENLVIACPPCNTSKQDKLPHEWAGSNRLL